jgi:hypothetical protein
MPSLEELQDRPEPKLKGQSLAAYAVLDQAMVAIRRLTRDLNDPKEDWYVSFVAAVVLLRSVGHVLKNQDCEKNERVNSFVVPRWPEWQKEKALIGLDVGAGYPALEIAGGWS